MKEIYLEELAPKIGGRVEGDGKVLVRGVASLEDAGPGMLSFFGDPRLAEKAGRTRAGALVVPEGSDVFSGPRIESPNPYLSFAKAVAFFHPPYRVEEHRIHPSALVSPGVVLEEPVEIGPGVVVEEGVRIGRGTLVEAGCFLGRDCRVGRECRLHPRVVLYHETEIGDRVEIHAGAVLGADGFGYARDGARYVKFPQVGRVVVEEDVEIGANAAIDRAALGETRIRRGVKLDNLVHIAHNCLVGEDTAFAAQVGVSGSTEIGARCMIGGQAGFAGHSRVGDQAVVYAQSGVHGDIPPGTRWLGSPAQPAREAFRNIAAFSRLHEMARRLRALEKRLEGREGP